MKYKEFELINERGHVAISKNGYFVSTADNIDEAKRDIDNELSD